MGKKTPIRENIKKVIEALREGNKTYSELGSLGIPEKTLDRILKDNLEYWGLIKKEGSCWVWHENKQVFQSKADYELALKHSKNVILTTSEKQGLDQTSIIAVLNELAFFEDNEEAFRKRWVSDYYFDRKYLLQHIKTGYPEILRLIQKYRELEIKQSFSDTDSKELEYVQDLFAGKMARLIRNLKDGIPLSGFCDGCPRKTVTIKEE